MLKRRDRSPPPPPRAGANRLLVDGIARVGERDGRRPACFGNRSYLGTLNQAIAKVHAATGLTFTCAGTTTATVDPDSRADLLVTWWPVRRL